MKITAKIHKDNIFWYFIFSKYAYSFYIIDSRDKMYSLKFTDNKIYKIPTTINIRTLVRLVNNHRNIVNDYIKSCETMKKYK